MKLYVQLAPRVQEPDRLNSSTDLPGARQMFESTEQVRMNGTFAPCLVLSQCQIDRLNEIL